MSLLGGTAAGLLAVSAQQTIWRIGMLLPATEDDAEFRVRASGFGF
jgi:hypothetical protein